MEYSAATTRNATTAAGFSYSTKDLARNIKRLEWFGYEVDPEWAQFCEFGPDDIGGPFEKLGIIRKRPRYDTVIAHQRVIDKMNELAWQQCMGHKPGSMPDGMKVVASDLIPPDRAYLIKVDLPLGPLYPSRGMRFFGDT